MRQSLAPGLSANCSRIDLALPYEYTARRRDPDRHIAPHEYYSLDKAVISMYTVFEMGVVS